MRDFIYNAAVAAIWVGLLVVVVLMVAVSSGCGADPPTRPRRHLSRRSSRTSLRMWC